MSKDLVFDKAMRLAFTNMSSPEINGNPNPFYVRADKITMPAMLIQEKPLLASDPNPVFEFAASNSEKPDLILNNIRLAQNDVATVFAFQVLIGYGATKNIRQYFSYGLSVDDDVVYRSKLQVKFESNDLITSIDCNQYRSENGTSQAQYDGAALINPQRTVTGRNSIIQLTLAMG